MNARVENIKMCTCHSALNQNLKHYQHFCIDLCAPPHPISLLYVHLLVITSVWDSIMAKNADSVYINPFYLSFQIIILGIIIDNTIYLI